MNISQRRLIPNAFIMSQFSYCPLIWMFHSRAMEHGINRIHERTLRLISPEVVNSLFEFTNKNYSLRNASILKRKRYLSLLWR